MIMQIIKMVIEVFKLNWMAKTGSISSFRGTRSLCLEFSALYLNNLNSKLSFKNKIKDHKVSIFKNEFRFFRIFEFRMSRVIECDDTEFFTRTLDNSRTFVVDFNATWCRPCREMAPIFNSLSQQFPYLTFLSVDIDKVSFWHFICKPTNPTIYWCHENFRLKILQRNLVFDLYQRLCLWRGPMWSIKWAEWIKIS